MASNPDKSAQQVKNNQLIIAVWTNKDTKEKITNIQRIILSGADVNTSSANLKHNTALHVAVRKADIDIVKLLLENGADPSRTNSLDETPLDIARTVKGNAGQEILRLLEVQLKKFEEATTEELAVSDSEDNKPDKYVDTHGPNYFLMQDRNTGVRGHLYETKLLCLVILRAENDTDIENYYLASNIAGVGVFDDIGFKYNVKGREKSIRIFLQAKHRELPKKGRLTVEDVLKQDGDPSLASCFDSFIKIKQKFDPKKGDHPMFRESYDNVELNFIVYTSGEQSFNRKLIGRNERSPKVHKLIYTGGKKSIFQFDYKDEDIYSITKDVQKMRIELLAYNLIEFIFGEKDKYKHMLEDDIIRKYQCVLEQKALRFCNVDKNYIEAQFRPELFNSTDTFISFLREQLCKVMIERCCIKPTKAREGIVKEFKCLPREPSSIALSAFIGTLVTYDTKNNKLKVLDNVSKRGLKSNDIKELNNHLKQVYTNPEVIASAVMMAGEKKLLEAKFKLPSSFGNMDMLIKDTRVAYIVSMFKDLFEVNKSNGRIVINESDLGKNLLPNSKTTLTEGFVGYNGGIGSAVGNLLIYHENEKTLKFNPARPLYEKAYTVLTELEKVLPEGKKLSDYIIKVNTYNFPRAAFSNDDYDNSLARVFLNRLWFYCNQGKEDEVERVVKTEIEKFYNAHSDRSSFRFRTHIDSIFSKFHSEVQKWWMVSSDNNQQLLTHYLTTNSDIFRIAQEGIDSPLLALHSEMYISTIKKTGIEFTADAVKRLGLDDRSDKIINILTGNCMLSAIKMHQYYKNQNNYNFIDLSYMLSLPSEDQNVMLDEIKGTSVQILIIICGPPRNDPSANDDLNNIINTFKGNKLIFVTTAGHNSSMPVRLPQNHVTINDTMNHLMYFDEESKKRVAEEAVVTFQDEKIRLADLLDENIITKINTEMLSHLMDNDGIEVGRSLVTKNYEEIKDYYVPRRLIKEGSDVAYPVDSMDDIGDKVVLLITKHGMGKSTLMTHISLGAKKMNPTKWIVRINLADFENDFYNMQKSRTPVNKATVLKLLCLESLKHVTRKTDFQLRVQDGAMVLDTNASKTLNGLTLFELELFLHKYNQRDICFFFYGFDYVCPPFGDEVTKLLKIIKEDDITMWIASHAVAIPTRTLESNFGTSYKLKLIDKTGQQGFYYKFWKTNIALEKENTEVCSIIAQFLEFMSGKSDLHGKQNRMLAPWVSMPLHIMYLMAVEFFGTELNKLSTTDVQRTLKKYLDIDLNIGSTLSSLLDNSPEAGQAAELAGTPLHMYIAANYFQCKFDKRFHIEPNAPEIRKKWDLWQDSVHLYERFLKHNMDKVCLRTDCINIDEDHENEKRQEFFNRHKKLLLLAICTEEDLGKLLPAEEIEELRDTIRRIQSGEEKSALADCVINNVPKFFHVMFAEYSAVEVLTDFLKNARTGSLEKMNPKHLWDFVVNMILYSSSDAVRSAFDYNLKNDATLAEVASSDECKTILFDLLLRGNANGRDAGAPSSAGTSHIKTAVDHGMNNLVKVLLLSIETNINEQNMKTFTSVLEGLDVFTLLLNVGDVPAPTNFTDFFTDMRFDKIINVLKSEQSVEVPITVLTPFLHPDIIKKTREKLNEARLRLADKATEQFGLTDENVALFRRLADTIKRCSKK